MRCLTQPQTDEGPAAGGDSAGAAALSKELTALRGRIATARAEVRQMRAEAAALDRDTAAHGGLRLFAAWCLLLFSGAFLRHAGPDPREVLRGRRVFVLYVTVHVTYPMVPILAMSTVGAAASKTGPLGVVAAHVSGNCLAGNGADLQAVAEQAAGKENLAEDASAIAAEALRLKPLLAKARRLRGALRAPHGGSGAELPGFYNTYITNKKGEKWS